MPRDINDQIREYEGLVNEFATSFAKSKAARNSGAEYDDLRQEGLLAVWQALGRSVTPSRTIIELRMKGWIRLLSRQTGKHLPEEGQPQHVPYEAMLPLDDYRSAQKADLAAQL